jgi:hypothetical protein
MRELVDLLVRSNIPLLIIGGHAVGMHGAQRDTIDLDCVVVAERREEMKAFLESRGFEEAARHESFSRYRHQSLLYPLLDVMQVDEKTWQKLSAESVPKVLKGLPVRVPAVGHLIALKLHAIRQNPARELQDADDIARLLRANPETVPPEELRALFERYQLPELFAKVLKAL